MNALRLVTMSPELLGVVFSLLAFAGWPLRSVMLAYPVVALIAFCMIGALAGYGAGGLASHVRLDPRISVRRGTRAALSATLWSGVWVLIMIGTLPGWEATLKALLLPVSSFLPGTLAGSVGSALGAFQFHPRTDAGAESQENEPTEVPMALRIGTWIGLFPAYAAAALCTLVPGRTTTSLIRAAAPAASKPRATAEKEFAYAAASELLTAHPYRWHVTTTRELGGYSGRTLVLDHDQRRLAGALSSNDAVVQITGLNQPDTLSFPPLPFVVARLAFNPAGDQLVAVSSRPPRTLAILKCEGLQTILLPQPSNYQIPDEPIAWVQSNAICFFGSQFKQQLLNLESLEISPLERPQRDFDSVRYSTSPGMVTSDRWTFRIRTQMPTASMLPEVEGTPGWPVVLRERLALMDTKSYAMRVFPEIDSAEEDRWMGVQEGSILLRIRGTQLTAHYFGFRQYPPTRWSLQMPHGPEKLPNPESISNSLKGCELRLFVYAPLTNPLTNKTVGPDRRQLKATLILSEWKDNQAECWMAINYLPILAGDVVADLHVHEEERTLLPLGSPQRWWSVLPEPTSNARDQDELPTRESVSERQAEGQTLESARLAAATAKPTPPLKEGEPKEPESTKSAEVPAAANESDQVLLKQLIAFLENHHALATQGKTDELTQNYAEKVDHFNNGIVDRKFIFRDQSDYHQKYSNIRERFQDLVKVTQMADGRVRVEYAMVNEWTKNADGTRGGGTHSVTLDLIKQGHAWKIVRHRASKKN